MTQEQLDRWEMFSRAMAANGFKNITDARRAKLSGQIDRFFVNLRDEPYYWLRFRSWDHNEPWHPPLRDERSLFDGGVEMYCCDYASAFMEGVPGYWSLTDKQYENWRFESQIDCCLRAGIDTAAEPSAGVLGFNVGDLRRMFGGNIPDWVNATYIGEEHPDGLLKAADAERVWL